MALTLSDVRRIAGQVAKQQTPPLEVVGAVSGEGAAIYAEVIMTVSGCHVEPCQLVIGVSRVASETECREAVQARLQEHLRERL